MRRFLFRGGIGAILAAACATVLLAGESPPPDVGPGSRKLRDELRNFSTLGLYMGGPTDLGQAPFDHSPLGAKFAVTARNDRVVVFEPLDGNRRYTWDGTNLWYDYLAEQNDPPPNVVPHPEAAGLISDAWNALRGGSAQWLPKGPADYGWGKHNNGEVSEIVIPPIAATGFHVFVLFAHQPLAPKTLLVVSPSGREYSFPIYQVTWNPTRPQGFFGTHAIPGKPPFPDICEGLACAVVFPPPGNP
jgi:hypothetical protein